MFDLIWRIQPSIALTGLFATGSIYILRIFSGWGMFFIQRSDWQGHWWATTHGSVDKQLQGCPILTPICFFPLEMKTRIRRQHISQEKSARAELSILDWILQRRIRLKNLQSTQNLPWEVNQSIIFIYSLIECILSCQFFYFINTIIIQLKCFLNYVFIIAHCQYKVFIGHSGININIITNFHYPYRDGCQNSASPKIPACPIMASFQYFLTIKFTQSQSFYFRTQISKYRPQIQYNLLIWLYFYSSMSDEGAGYGEDPTKMHQLDQQNSQKGQYIENQDSYGRTQIADSKVHEEEDENQKEDNNTYIIDYQQEEGQHQEEQQEEGDSLLTLSKTTKLNDKIRSMDQSTTGIAGQSKLSISTSQSKSHISKPLTCAQSNKNQVTQVQMQEEEHQSLVKQGSLINLAKMSDIQHSTAQQTSILQLKNCSHKPKIKQPSRIDQPISTELKGRVESSLKEQNSDISDNSSQFQVSRIKDSIKVQKIRISKNASNITDNLSKSSQQQSIFKKPATKIEGKSQTESASRKNVVAFKDNSYFSNLNVELQESSNIQSSFRDIKPNLAQQDTGKQKSSLIKVKSRSNEGSPYQDSQTNIVTPKEKLKLQNITLHSSNISQKVTLIENQIQKSSKGKKISQISKTSYNDQLEVKQKQKTDIFQLQKTHTNQQFLKSNGIGSTQVQKILQNKLSGLNISKKKEQTKKNSIQLTTQQKETQKRMKKSEQTNQNQTSKGKGNKISQKKEEVKWIVNPFGKKYEFIKAIGQGGFGEVYLTKDEKAIKRLNLSKYSTKANMLEYLKREIDILKSIQHQNVVGFIEEFQVEGYQYIVMEKCEGSLSSKIKQKTMSEGEALKVFGQIIMGYNELYRRNIVHRDLKPDNILIGKEGEWKIADMGLCKILEDCDQTMKTSLGTMYYRAPEQYVESGHFARYTYKCDIWSLGLILYQMLTGKFPWQGTKTAFYASATSQPPNLKGVIASEWVLQLLQHMIKANEQERIDFVCLVKTLNEHGINPTMEIKDKVSKLRLNSNQKSHVQRQQVKKEVSKKEEVELKKQGSDRKEQAKKNKEGSSNKQCSKSKKSEKSKQKTHSQITEIPRQKKKSQVSAVSTQKRKNQITTYGEAEGASNKMGRVAIPKPMKKKNEVMQREAGEGQRQYEKLMHGQKRIKLEAGESVEFKTKDHKSTKRTIKYDKDGNIIDVTESDETNRTKKTTFSNNKK